MFSRYLACDDICSDRAPTEVVDNIQAQQSHALFMSPITELGKRVYRIGELCSIVDYEDISANKAKLLRMRAMLEDRDFTIQIATVRCHDDSNYITGNTL